MVNLHFRPIALRPILSNGLPLSTFQFYSIFKQKKAGNSAAVALFVP